jgi:hypothetical protein
MIRDIEIPEVKNVTLAIIREKVDTENSSWKVYLINTNSTPIETVLVASTGYGAKNNEEQRTSVLRHFLEIVPASGSVAVETIDEAVFHLNNEYWVSYYIGSTLYDKRFVFVPDSIREENVMFIEELGAEGILHS